MNARHQAPGSGRFIRELVFFVLRFVVLAALLGVVVWFVWRASDSGETDEPAASPVTTAVVESTLSAPPPTDAAEPSTTSAPTATSTPATSVVPSSTEATTTTTEATSTTERALRPPAELTVQVLNANGQTGLAARVTAVVADLGYQTVEAANYPRREADSFVRYGPGLAAEARALARELEGVEIESDPTADLDSDLVLIVGLSYIG